MRIWGKWVWKAAWAQSGPRCTSPSSLSFPRDGPDQEGRRGVCWSHAWETCSCLEAARRHQDLRPEADGGVCVCGGVKTEPTRAEPSRGTAGGDSLRSEPRARQEQGELLAQVGASSLSTQAEPCPEAVPGSSRTGPCPPSTP